MTISCEILNERRPFKTLIYSAADGVKMDRPTIKSPGHIDQGTTRRDFKSLLFVTPGGSSDFITTRCYSPDGIELWNADHGSRVLAMAVDAAGNVYQAGDHTQGAFGDSFFHEVEDDDWPLVTKLTAKGETVWAKTGPVRPPSDQLVAKGVCVTPGGYVYTSIGTWGGTTQDHIAKLRSLNGHEVLQLPTAAFDFYMAPPMFQRFGQVRCDAAGNVIAMGNRVNSGVTFAFKWVNDLPYWQFYRIDIQMMQSEGMDVMADGRFAMGAKAHPSEFYEVMVVGGPERDTQPANQSTVLAKIVETYQGDFCKGVACSPNGKIFFKRSGGTIVELVVTADPLNPILIPHVTRSELVVEEVFFDRIQAIAVNDAGVYCYSRDRVHSSPNVSHEIRAADDSLILAADHGGQIWACAVLPDGKVIVAGDRVPK